MCDRQNQMPLVSLCAYPTSAQSQNDVAETALRRGQSGGEREKGRRQIVHSLQQWNRALLIRNQELRMSLLDLPANFQSGEF